MHKLLRISLIYLSITSLLQAPVLAQSKPSKKGRYNVKELVLPSEVENVSRSSGAIFYSPSVKGKVLIPVHFWGKVSRPGLHFIPSDTSLVKGLSMAGGPASLALLDDVKLTRPSASGDYENFSFDIEHGGDKVAHTFKLQPGDTIFLEDDTYLADRSYYTSLIGVIVTILSGILLYDQVKNRP